MTGFLDNWGPTLVAAAGVTVVAVSGAVLTPIDGWYKGLRKPSWQPPDWLFGPAWTVIFILEAASAVIGWRTTHGAATAILIVLYVLNGGLNVLWSLLFFKMRRPDLALAEVGFLWASVLALIVMLDIHAGRTWLFMLPYLLWVSFAAYLNLTIVRLNTPFRAVA